MFRRSQSAAVGDASQLQSCFAVLMIAAGEVPNILRRRKVTVPPRVLGSLVRPNWRINRV